VQNFEVERDRTKVEGDRIRVDEFWFVSIGLVTLNRSWYPVFIGWGDLVLVGIIKSTFESSNWIRSVGTDLASRLNRSESVQKSENFKFP
jgi:hypothetical protein